MNADAFIDINILLDTIDEDPRPKNGLIGFRAEPFEHDPGLDG
jgi:hypothetical protein